MTSGKVPRRATSPRNVFYAALACFLLWSFVTWLLEGRVETLLRPRATLQRLLYTAIANVVIGQVGALAMLGVLVRRAGSGLTRARPRLLRYRGVTITAAVAVGLGYYTVAGGSFADPVVVTNAFAQVFVVSAAEVIVCWGLVGVATESWLCAHRGPWSSAGIAAVAASAAFGLYHFAHSPPFNTPAMVAFLAIVGLGTSVVFFATRDLLATIIFHNFPAVAGVTSALTDSGQLHALDRLQPALLSTAVMSLIIVLVGERLALGRIR